MKRALKKLTAFGVIAALAAASNAAIVINIPAADGYDTGNGTAVVDNTSLSDFSVFSGLGNGPIAGSFTFKSTLKRIVKISAQVKTNSVSLGEVSFDANILGVGSVLHRSASEDFGDDASMSTDYQDSLVSLAPNTWYTLNWSANFTGSDEYDAYASISQADFVFSEAVPEPTSIAAIAIGFTGLVARRRKGAK